jgi:serine phosphatase RsbU (regulator of sigma subunit)
LNKEFDHDRFKQSILNYSSLDAQEFTTGMVNELKTYKGEEAQFDDLTMIALKCNSAR